MSRKLAGIVVGLLAASGVARAMPASPQPIPLENADGSVILGQMFGDERLSWVEDLSGFAIAFDETTRTWTYAERGADGDLHPTRWRVGRADPVAAGLTPHLAPSRARIERALAERRRAEAAVARARPQALRFAPLPPNPANPRVVRNLVLLVKFSDQTPTYQAADFEPVFNGATGSVREFYKEISYGTFDLVSTIVGWIPLPNPASTYRYNSRYENGRPQQMLADAIAYLDAQGFDFAAFDAEGDGLIDAVDIVHSGESYESSNDPNTIHSHYAAFDGFMSRSPVTQAGLRFPGYHTEAEFAPDGVHIAHIGVICHETAHFFGAPDLYDYGYDSSGLGLWSLMAGGSWGGPGMDQSRPTHPDAYVRVLLGFATPKVVTEAGANLRLPPVEQTAEIARLDRGLPANQYFLLENRQKLGFDQSMPGSGLLIFHVDEGQYDNDDQTRYLVDLEQADGRRDLNTRANAWGDGGDPYPNSSGNNRFTPTSRPSSNPYGLGAAPSVLWVTNVARVGGDIRFDVDFREPKALGEPCAAQGECAAGFCADGVCCEKACEGECLACSAEAGALADGRCTALTGTACDDGSACTVGDACAKGTCRGTAKTCPGDACNDAGYCNAASGQCVLRPKVDGTGCDDDNPCTQKDVCMFGACIGGDPRVCAPEDACHAAGVCQRETGQCTSPLAPDGVACGETAVCSAGACLERHLDPPPDPPRSGWGCASAGRQASPIAALLVLAFASALGRRRVRG